MWLKKLFCRVDKRESNAIISFAVFMLGVCFQIAPGVYGAEQKVKLQTDIGQAVGWLTPPSSSASDPNSGYVYFSRDLAMPHHQTSMAYHTKYTHAFKQEKGNVRVESYTASKTGREGQERATAFYFVENLMNIGYLLVQRQFIVQDLAYFRAASSVPIAAKDLLERVKSDLNQIQSLDRVSERLPLSGETLDVYTTRHDGFVERFGLLRKEGQYYLVLDAFYPEAMDREYYPKSLAQLDVYLSQGMWSFETHRKYSITG